MPDDGRRSTIEMTAGGITMTTGLFLLQLPLPRWPNMDHLLVALGISLGLTLLACGFAVFVVGLSRHHGKDWPAKMVDWWDFMWARKAVVVFAPCIVTAVFLIAFLFVAQADEPAPAKTPSPAAGPSSTDQRGGQTGGTNNNYGPTYNGPFIPSPMTRSEATGPVTVKNSNQCPRGWMIIESSTFERNGVGISAPIGAHICVVNNQFIENGVGYEMRSK